MTQATETAAVENDQNPQGEVDFTRFEGIGLTSKAGWYVSAILYGTGGVFFALAWLVGGWVPTSVGILGTVSLLLSFSFVAAARWIPDADWGAHFRIGCGTAIILIGEMLVGRPLSAFSLLILYPLLAVVYLYEARISIPYLLFCTGATAAVLAGFSGDPTAHTIVTSTMLLAIGVATIVSQQEIRNIALINSRLAVVDPLTGVANVRKLQEVIAATIGSREPGMASPTLFAMDLDNFKRVNDEFSHSLGDEVLRAVADSLKQESERGFVVARRGGDEFSVFVPDPGDHDMDVFADRLRLAIRRARLAVCPDVTPTGSVGFVKYQEGDTVDEFMMSADAALHHAKLEAHPERRNQTAHEHRLGRNHDESTDAAPAGDGERSEHGLRDNDLQMARAIKHVLGFASSWQVLSILVIAAVLSLVLSGMTATGGELFDPIPVAALLGLIAVAGSALLLVRRNTSEWPMHVALVTATALITVIAMSVTEVRASIADIYLVPIVAAFYAFKPRRALPYFLVGIGLFSYVLISATYDFTTERIVFTTVITLVLVAMLAKARALAREFTAHAVELSVVDPLTGAANVRGLRRSVAEAVDLAEGTDVKVAMFFVDLDDFKSVNDKYSHTLGDRTLVAVTRAMESATRDIDVVARRGGDEFALLMTIKDELEVTMLATRIGSRIREVRAEIAPDITPTASIGTVILKPGETADEFLTRADNELHEAKVAEHQRFERSYRLESA